MKITKPELLVKDLENRKKQIINQMAKEIHAYINDIETRIVAKMLKDETVVEIEPWSGTGPQEIIMDYLVKLLKVSYDVRVSNNKLSISWNPNWHPVNG